MKNVIILMAVVSLTVFTACEPKTGEETTIVETPTNATDIAETTAVPIDTTGLTLDSLGTDSLSTQ